MENQTIDASLKCSVWSNLPKEYRAFVRGVYADYKQKYNETISDACKYPNDAYVAANRTAYNLVKFTLEYIFGASIKTEELKLKYKMQGGFSVFKDGKPYADFDMPTLEFEAEELAQQAAEEVRKRLEEIHATYE